MSLPRPAPYWRQTKKLPELLGKTGTVIFATTTTVLVEIQSQKYELIPSLDSQLKTGDKIICVFRRLSTPTQSGLIEYGIKVKKITIDK